MCNLGYVTCHKRVACAGYVVQSAALLAAGGRTSPGLSRKAPPGLRRPRGHWLTVGAMPTSSPSPRPCSRYLPRTSLVIRHSALPRVLDGASCKCQWTSVLHRILLLDPRSNEHPDGHLRPPHAPVPPVDGPLSPFAGMTALVLALLLAPGSSAASSATAPLALGPLARDPLLPVLGRHLHRVPSRTDHFVPPLRPLRRAAPSAPVQRDAACTRLQGRQWPLVGAGLQPVPPGRPRS